MLSRWINTNKNVAGKNIKKYLFFYYHDKLITLGSGWGFSFIVFSFLHTINNCIVDTWCRICLKLPGHIELYRSYLCSTFRDRIQHCVCDRINRQYADQLFFWPDLE